MDQALLLGSGPLGTAAATPNGQIDPTSAAVAARAMRREFSR
jgi:hypothetical protein